MKLVTSNPNKLREFRELGLDLDIAPGLDLREVQGTIDEVIIHKAKEAGAGLVVEDTVLMVNGEEIVDIRWRIREFAQQEGTQAQWVVSLGYNDGETIRVYRGVIHGHLVNRVPREGSFGFNPYFIPQSSQLTLDELDVLGRKRDYSARSIAATELMAGRPVIQVALADVTEWTGPYQNS
jgi:inosine/xanthosine triphosphate pyrophosphatase family protein